MLRPDVKIPWVPLELIIAELKKLKNVAQGETIDYGFDFQHFLYDCFFKNNHYY